MSDDSIPVIDIGELDSAATARRDRPRMRAIGASSRSRATAWTASGDRRDVRDGAREFFAQPAADKRRLLRDADNPWGFFDKELTKNRQDWKEIYDYGPDVGDGRAPRWPHGPLRHRFEPGRARLLRQLHGAGVAPAGGNRDQPRRSTRRR